MPDIQFCFQFNPGHPRSHQSLAESVVVAYWRHWFPLPWTLLVGSSHSFSVPVPPRISCHSRGGSSWLCMGEKDTGRCASQGCVGTAGQQCDLTCQSPLQIVFHGLTGPSNSSWGCFLSSKRNNELFSNRSFSSIFVFLNILDHSGGRTRG